jgi:type II secretory pathway predicted ATPase ExeA
MEPQARRCRTLNECSARSWRKTVGDGQQRLEDCEMYEEFFGLRSRPFLAAPQVSRFFPAATIENARKTLTRAIERGEGAGVIMGPSGTGKTLLCQVLAEQFKSRFCIAMLTGARLTTRGALLQAIVYELGLPHRGLDEGELRLSLLDRLNPAVHGGEGLLLLVDEAHTLPARLLDEVRMLTNLVRDGVPRVRVVLAGASVLEERLANPKLSSFSQRLAARCYLEAMNRGETAEYVRSQIVAVGGQSAQVFDDDALSSVYRATDGVPRLINQVCDHALILASLGGMRPVTSLAVEEAWADLQQLPAPWSASREAASGASQVVEFGGLDEPVEELPEAIPFRSNAMQPLHLAAPEDQLDAIEAQLSTIDDQLGSSTTLASEAELDFPEFGDPFGEQFAVEEVVVDPYATDTEVFANAPQVTSWEGQQIASALGSLEASQRNAASHRPQIKLSAAPMENPTLAAPTVPSSSIAAAGSPSTTPVAPRVQTAESLRNQPQSPAGEKPATLQMARADDREMIIIEEDRAAPAQAGQQSVARKMEYRQLFAKLRRG